MNKKIDLQPDLFRCGWCYVAHKIVESTIISIMTCAPVPRSMLCAVFTLVSLGKMKRQPQHWTGYGGTCWWTLTWSTYPFILFYIDLFLRQNRGYVIKIKTWNHPKFWKIFKKSIFFYVSLGKSTTSERTTDENIRWVDVILT